MSDDALFDSHWYRVRNLRPGLAVDVGITPKLERGVPRFVLHRRSTRKWHRVGLQAYELIRRMDGRHTVEELWRDALDRHGEDAPGQGEIITLLAQLHQADLLAVDRKLDTEHLFDKGQTQRREEERQRYLNPLYLRFPLFDPDRVICAIYRRLPKVPAHLLLAVFVMLVIGALLTALSNGDELAAFATRDVLLQPQSLLLMALVYPVMKLIHEFAHALTIKHFGGDVREAGIAFLVLLPNPYVDASAMNTFASRLQRIAVSAAGIIAELTLAAIATFVWASGSGDVRDVAFAVMIIGSLSTLLVNGNPLMRFDGYYLLTDFLEIPNLQSRARDCIAARVARRFGAESRVADPDRATERWLIGYGVSSAVYRVGLTMLIAWTVSQQYFFMGTLLAFWALGAMAWPALRRFNGFVRHQGKDVQHRIALTLGIGVLSLGTAAAAIPLPSRTVTDGVVWLPDQSVLHVPRTCRVTDIEIPNGTVVAAGTPLLRCNDTELDSRIAVLRAQLDEVHARRAGLALTDPVQDQLQRLAGESLQQELSHLLSERQALQFTAPVDGEFITDDETLLPGVHLSQGSVAAYVVPRRERTIRIALDENAFGALQPDTDAVAVRLSDPWVEQRVFDSRIQRLTPRATRWLPSATLTRAGGGDLALAESGDQREVADAVFDIELAWPSQAPVQPIGARVRVRIEHTARPLLGKLLEKASRLATYWRDAA